jgi:hypothetical protein
VDIGSENTFSIKIMDASGHEIPEATCDIILCKGDQHLGETHRADQKASEQSLTFDEQGSCTLRIENINDSGENNSSISIPIQVTPEFPLGILVRMAAAFASTVIEIESKYLLESFHSYLKFPF